MSNSDTIIDMSAKQALVRIPFQKTGWVFVLKLKDTENPELPLQLEVKSISEKDIHFVSNRKISVFEEIEFELVGKSHHYITLQLKAIIRRVDETDLGEAEKIYGMWADFNQEQSPDAQAIKQALESL